MSISRLAAVIWLVAALAGCSSETPRPPLSFLLFVFDTTRLDAVSAYGRAADTTPVTDALAAVGLRYTRAYANAPWTLPSHVSLFTGLLPRQHGVGWARTRAPRTLVTLAERLQDAGYETIGISENPWVTETFNLAQGFERFTAVGDSSPQTTTVLTEWVRETRGDRPFFLFVNVVDSHAPYEVRGDNPFVPSGVSAEDATLVSQNLVRYICSSATLERERAILRGLYLGDVAAADAKLGEVLRLLRTAGLDHNLVTIVTSDHGEHLGEHRLFDHQFSIREALISVPLVVHGLPGVPSAVIDQPVQLVGIMPTVLRWAGLPVPGGLAGKTLPTTPNAPDAGSTVIAEWYDPDSDHAEDQTDFARGLRSIVRALRHGCGPHDRVFGGMRALIRYPLKLVWYEHYPAELYDLSADPEEQNDLASARPSVVAALAAELMRQGAGRSPSDAAPAGTTAPVPGKVRDRLRSLGYLGHDSDPGSADQ